MIPRIIASILVIDIKWLPMGGALQKYNINQILQDIKINSEKRAIVAIKLKFSI
jgi:hypothetical protein